MHSLLLVAATGSSRFLALENAEKHVLLVALIYVSHYYSLLPLLLLATPTTDKTVCQSASTSEAF
jgi:hypothetical protein